MLVTIPLRSTKYTSSQRSAKILPARYQVTSSGSEYWIACGNLDYQCLRGVMYLVTAMHDIQRRKALKRAQDEWNFNLCRFKVHSILCAK